MKTLFLAAAMTIAVGLHAAEMINAKAAGTTLASIAFPGVAGQSFRLVSADVTSDKAGSLLTWLYADGVSATLIRAAANDATALLCYPNTFASNTVLVQAGLTVTENTNLTRLNQTNAWVYFRDLIGTNQAVNDPVYDFATNYTLIHTNANIATNATALAVASSAAFQANDVILITSKTNGWSLLRVVQSVATTNITITAELAGYKLYNGDRIQKLGLIGTNILTALRTDQRLLLTTSSGLTTGERVILSPASGGLFTNYFSHATEQILSLLTLSAATGTAMAAGESIYAATVITTPIGAATLRQSGPGVFVAPRGRPGLLRLDGTSAVKLNVVTGVYE